MKTIALLRHAKSDWDAGASSDFDRPLSKRGRAAASAMGRFIRRECGGYDHVLVSPARRCRETWDGVCEACEDRPNVELVDAIYLANAGNLLELLREQDDSSNRLLIVGHNPGLTYLALELIREDDAQEERERIAQKFPTAAFVELECEIDRWADLKTAACRLERRRYPVEEKIEAKA